MCEYQKLLKDLLRACSKGNEPRLDETWTSIMRFLKYQNHGTEWTTFSTEDRRFQYAKSISYEKSLVETLNRGFEKATKRSFNAIIARDDIFKSRIVPCVKRRELLVAINNGNTIGVSMLLRRYFDLKDPPNFRDAVVMCCIMREDRSMEELVEWMTEHELNFGLNLVKEIVRYGNLKTVIRFFHNIGLRNYDPMMLVKEMIKFSKGMNRTSVTSFLINFLTVNDIRPKA